ncbi:uncharacterized protein N7459_000106 [Penicillium hispanicum]|uniref:uncharacterized protein n=1 Tax=Penicillium hispanicum TaxID=1080232 RepID=UPI002540FCE9|nr:uncharacterized protein N7459_000106 [Penicillium hispanicum]KAJ5593898.1 hypothetical protein N7459_000106 [Penicillium hispanicum]
MSFKLPHTADTFLPPIIDLVTGTEQTFAYMPQCHQGSLRGSKYGSPKMTDLLIKQYPPLFHAATDIPSFVRAMSLMKNLRHLRIISEGQPHSHRYRRSVVDYALISLRMAVELAPLASLSSLSLLSVHPAAVLYLQPNLGFGTSPGSRKRWSQIRHLTIHMASFPHEVERPTDHFKLLHAYLQSFPRLRRLVFHWEGEKSLSPLSLATEPGLQRSSKSPLKQYGFPRLGDGAGQCDHRHSLHECNFQNITLRAGTWEEALAPLTQLSHNQPRKEKQTDENSVNVPIVLSPGE